MATTSGKVRHAASSPTAPSACAPRAVKSNWSEPETFTVFDLQRGNCRGGPLWPPVITRKREFGGTGGHGGPPLQLFIAMRIILNTFGSFGDIHPYMAIALELQRRGHVPVIATMEGYREKIAGAGLQFAPVRPDVELPNAQGTELVEKIMEPKTGPRFLTEEVIFPAVRDSYTDLLESVDGADLLVTHPAAPAGPLLGRKIGMPWISTVLAPLSFYSAYDPPVPPFWQWTRKLHVL